MVAVRNNSLKDSKYFSLEPNYSRDLSKPHDKRKQRNNQNHQHKTEN